MRNALAAAAALTALAFTGTAHADVTGPTCQVGGNLVITGICAFGHPSFTSLSVSATATGLPGVTAVHIAIREFGSTGIGAVVLECSGMSDGLTDPDAGCSATVAYSGAGSFVCLIDSNGVTYSGTCEGTVTS